MTEYTPGQVSLRGTQGSLNAPKARQYNEGINSLTDTLQKVATLKAERADANALRQAQMEINQFARQYEREVRKARQGMLAEGVTAAAARDFNDRIAQIRQSLGNQNQMEAFDAYSERFRDGHLEALSRYETQEFTRTQEASYQALMDSAMDNARDAVIQAGSPYEAASLIGVAQADMLAQNEKMGQLGGMPQAVVDSQKRALLEKFHTNIVLGTLDSNPEAARKWYDGNRQHFSLEVSYRLENSLHYAENRKQGRLEAQRIIVQSGGDRERAKEAARQIENPEAQEVAVSRIDEVFDNLQQQKKQRQIDAREEAYRLVNEKGMRSHGFPASLREQMNPDDLRAMAAVDYSTRTNRQKWHEFLDQAAEGAFMGATPSEVYVAYGRYFSKSDWEKALQYIGKGTPELTRLRAVKAAAYDADAEDQAALLEKLERQLEMDGETGKEYTFSELQAMVRVLRGEKLMRDNFFFDEPEYVKNSEAREDKDKYYLEYKGYRIYLSGRDKNHVGGDIWGDKLYMSKKERQMIQERFIKKHGRNPTHAEIVGIFYDRAKEDGLIPDADKSMPHGS